MKRTKSDAKKNSGFYIAVCGCVAIAGAIGYWNRRPTKQEEMPRDSAEKYVLQTEDLTVSKPKETALPVKTEKKESKPKTTDEPIQAAEPVALKLFGSEEAIHLNAAVSGKLCGKFSGDNLVFHTSTGDWRTHNGADYAAETGEAVCACADGVVEKVYTDSLGHCVLLDHGNGYRTLYANLAEAPEELVGKNVKQGEEIGRIGASALADLSEETHLHLEVIREEEVQNPSEYLK